ncbi:glycosyltransferase family 2 protein [Salegentibacter flavus]|uniref:Glycosyltransferase involved in cell wall bisynthesis n=1 Tax=Salegentibacter flavus TaxID=287099 RepID=A0A1I4Y6H8_9FLAO|nr:glycosyltransferase family 2 protein [Salegentibacter flavus]SFN33110.1 Glycosyltransferase involved in cell wall bisynthesis [Salegentibacter flavus]
MKPLVSIIIPTYNRAHYIGETLESIIAQKYPNWECLVIDDSSTDYTEELMEFYCERDKRFRYHDRPKDTPKGANACRNYGFQLSKGQYVNWFDSDDLMSPYFIQKKVSFLRENDIDYVISFSKAFKDHNAEVIDTHFGNYYTFNSFSISNFNYVRQKNNWLTYDFMGRRELLEKVSFNEELQAFQERHFFSKLTSYSVKGKVLPVYLTYVRIHSDSIQNKLHLDKREYYKRLQEFFLITWEDLKNIAPKESTDYLFHRNLNFSMFQRTRFNSIFKIGQELLTRKKNKAFVYYFLFQFFYYLTGRGYYLRKNVLKNL